MAKYIIFTNNDESCFPVGKVRNPFSLMGLDAFGTESIVMIGCGNNQCVIDSPGNVEDCSVWDVLVHLDGTDLPAKFFNKFVKDEEIYVLLHKGVDDAARKTAQIKFIKNIINNGFENFIEHSHDSKSIYWNELVELAECVASDPVCKNTYSSILKKLQSRWPNPYLEPLIHLHKDLSLVQFKIIKNIITPQEGADVVKSIQQSEKAKLAACKINEIRADGKINELSNYLMAIEEEILKLSARK